MLFDFRGVNSGCEGSDGNDHEEIDAKASNDDIYHPHSYLINLCRCKLA